MNLEKRFIILLNILASIKSSSNKLSSKPNRIRILTKKLLQAKSIKEIFSIPP